MSDRRLKSLPVPEKKTDSYLDADTPGLTLEVYPSGKKTWRYRFAFGGRTGEQGKMKLGTYPATSLSTARARARDARALVEAGINPHKHKRAEHAAPTLADLYARYIESRHFKQLSKNHCVQVRAAFKRDVLPALGRFKAHQLRRGETRALIERIIDRGAPVQANRTLGYISALYNWAISQDLVETSPATHIRTEVKERPRERVLSVEEIRTLWHGLDQVNIASIIKLALKVQLATAQRPGEILAMRWADIDDEVWTIPSTLTKNRRLHPVPLSSLAMRLILSAPEVSSLPTASREPSPYVFASPLYPERAVTLATIERNVRTRILPALKMEPFTPHDLRRTAATMIASSGAERAHVKRILNHSDGSVTAIYDRYSYQNEKRHYLEKWARMLERIVTGEEAKVISLR